MLMVPASIDITAAIYQDGSLDLSWVLLSPSYSHFHFGVVQLRIDDDPCCRSHRDLPCALRTLSRWRKYLGRLVGKAYEAFDERINLRQNLCNMSVQEFSVIESGI